ncbi:cobalamin biosynthesis protein [Haematobacter massiliensis]|uniref:Bifunctional adenosylcobalamin biosynthesis protein n=1 Tax=Haematobacter massiliensis TaxID=195105 RepID=A0A086XZ86_9RHOB|nr:bifunctional adenosylcobinamide kinase/adenosylcobinamide-phosphate guanylyltransferase [Haematobacter massiliensis]KFI27336.1 cobalamin biosynthesis protein [Haematobacter massiliensis]OWJ84815.1 bifunctional adenosylcobinamide kinase/adenosylcobinamide-phosphate guanylyltransferase [Haematobacter massiliensis]QBJ23781.1 bifunctional adenosylcobinamide kinase/adenosylcobinamide-phosphate guanylyltransferase [Haematobacter massiliensis]
MQKKLFLILGGADSGKSVFAEDLVKRLAGSRARLCYIATADVEDEEMAQRVDRHKARRRSEWRLVEGNAEAALTALAEEEVALLDCATLWLSGRMSELEDTDEEMGTDLPAAFSKLEAALAAARGSVVIVSNETGLGIVPMHPLSRAFRAAQGQLNQRLAALADVVVLVVAGLPLVLKGELP